jgi:predicted dehydrogenase
MPTNSTLKVGLIGMGYGAQVLLPSLCSLENIVVSKVWVGRSGRNLTYLDGINPSPEIVPDPIVLAKSDELDAVIVASPPFMQERIVRAALKTGKAVYCEKPFGMDLKAAERMTSLARSLSATTVIGYQFRYDPGISALIDAVHAGMVGSISSIDVEWLTSGGLKADREWSWRNDKNQGGGVVKEFCSHVFDYLMFIVGDEISSIDIKTDIKVPFLKLKGTMCPVTAPDFCEMRVQLGDVTAQVSVSNTSSFPVGHRIVVYGSKGHITSHHSPPFGNEDLAVTMKLNSGERFSIKPNYDQSFYDINSDSRLIASRALMSNFFDSLRGQVFKKLPDFGAGLAVQRAISLAEQVE